MKQTNIYLDQIKDQYGNLLASWGVYCKTIALHEIEKEPKVCVKLLRQFPSLKEAQEHLENLTKNE